MSSPQQPFVVLVTAGWAEQEETGCSGQCSTAQLFVSRCQPALPLHCSSGGMPLMDYLPLTSQHSRQRLEKQQPRAVSPGTERSRHKATCCQFGATYLLRAPRGSPKAVKACSLLSKGCPPAGEASSHTSEQTAQGSEKGTEGTLGPNSCSATCVISDAHLFF